MFFFPILMKFAAAAAVFWLLSPRGRLDSAVKWGRRVAASFLVVIVVAYPYDHIAGPRWTAAVLVALASWCAGFALGWLTGLIVLRVKSR